MKGWLVFTFGLPFVVAGMLVEFAYRMFMAGREFYRYLEDL